MPASERPSAPSMWTEELDSILAAEHSSELRARLISAIDVKWGCTAAVIFEPTAAGGEFRPSVQAANLHEVAGLRFAPSGPLVRWLRVNNEPLNLRTDEGVVAFLRTEEREQLALVGADFCLPFVADDELIAFVVARNSTARLDGRDSPVGFSDWGRQVAVKWSGLRARESAAAVRNAIERSHQLGTAGEMAASIAHEVRNPLAAIRSSIQFALDETLAPVDRAEILRNVLRDLDRIDRTATGLLQLSRPLPFSRDRVRIERLVADAVEFLRPYASGRAVRLVYNQPLEPLIVLSDERELWQAIINLLLNACQACNAGGLVDVLCGRCADRDGFVEVLVKDSGAGIAADVLHRVFDPFFTTRADGSGLGLAFCRQTIERHGGAISLDSVQGSGTLVRVQLPFVNTDGNDSGR